MPNVSGKTLLIGCVVILCGLLWMAQALRTAQAQGGAVLRGTTGAPQAPPLFGEPDQTPLAQLLNPDGTVRFAAGFSGSLDVRGYRMKMTPQGAPQFVAAPQAPGDENWDARFVPQGVMGTDASVWALAVSGSDLYVGGYFTGAGGVAASNIAKWNGTSWSALGSGIGDTNSAVYAVAVSGSDVYVGGRFSAAGGVSANNIAKWNGTSWSALGSGISGQNGEVYALAVLGIDLYAGGSFTDAGGVTVSNIAKWNGANWSAVGGGVSGGVVPNVYSMLVNGGDLYVGGNFTVAGSVTVNGIAKWNGASWSALGSGINGIVLTMTLGGGELYVGGNFSSAGGVAANCVAKWNGSSWSGLGNGTDGPTAPVRSLAVIGSDVYVGGDFQYLTVGGGIVNIKHLAKWNGASWSAVGSDPNRPIYVLNVLGSDLYAGGYILTGVGGIRAAGIARWDGTRWFALGDGPDSAVVALAVNGGDLYVGGYFILAGGVISDNIAKWNGTSWSALGGGTAGPVTALAVSGGNLYAGGYFPVAGGVAANRIARWNGASWSALGGGVSDVVNALAVSGNDLYVGGFFTQAGLINANRIAKWNGAEWSSLGSGIDGVVRALAVIGGDLYAAGSFSTAGGVTVNNIAKWNGASWSALDSGTNATIYALAVNGNDLYVGGEFTTAGGIPANGLAKWNGTSWSALGTDIFTYVQALTVSGNNLYIGGSIATAGGVTVSNIAKWNGTSWSGLGSGTNNTVLALATIGNSVYAGGQFTTAGDKLSYCIGRYSDCSLAITPATLPAGTAGSPYSQSLTGSGGSSPYSFAIVTGSLPTSVSLTSGGLLSGTPTAFGPFNFTVRAMDNNGCQGTQAYTLTINPPCGTITVNPTTLPGGTVGMAYSQNLSAMGGAPNYTFTVSAGTLPGGLNLASGGALTGMPNAAGMFNFTIKATDVNGCMGTRAYTVVISGSGGAGGLQFYPLASPVRLLDTRTGATACTTPGSPIPAGTSLLQAAAGTCGIPATAKAVTGNVTVILPSANGFLTIYPSDASQPTVANTNFVANEVLNNVFTVGLGAVDGAFKVFASTTVEAVVDITGYYAPPGAGGLYFHSLPKPIRLLETRVGQPGCFTPGTSMPGNVDTIQQGTTTCDGVTIPATAKALVGNATTVFPAANGFITLYPADAGSRPLAASGNYRAGTVLNSPFTFGLSSSGQFKIYTVATTDLVIDVLGYFSGDATDVNGTGLLFTPLTPARLLDTRPGATGACFLPGAALTGGVESLQAARNVCTIPNTAQAIVGNATTVLPTANGFLTLWPSNAVTRPLAATSNFQSGRNYNRYFTVGLGTDGAFKMYASQTTNLVVDVSGYFAP